MHSTFNPHHVAIALKAVPVTASVATLASAKAAGLGPFRFVYVNASVTIDITFGDETTATYNDVPKGTYLWVQGDFISAIGATATSTYVMK